MIRRPLIASAGVSTLAAASERSATGETTSAGAHTGSPSPGGIAAFACLTAALVAIPFVTGGGVDEIAASPGNTWTEIALTLLGAGAFAVALLYGGPGRRRGMVTVGLMALLFAVEAASIAWSVAPDSSWLASGQMLAYLAVFAGAVAVAQLAPARWSVLLGALVASTVALCAWSLIAKVFPAALVPGNRYGRLQVPFGYWNALATSAAMGVPGCLWLGARRDAGRRLAVLAVPAMTILLVVLVLSYSRSADLAALIAAALWLALTPLRLRAVAVLAAGAVGAAVISGWALAHHALTHDGVAMAAQSHAGHIFGIVILVVLVAMTGAGVAIARSMDRVAVSARRRRRIGGGLLGLVALAVVVAIGGLAASHRGLTGEISHEWHRLTSPTAVSADNAGRVLQFGSSRPVYWHEALSVGDHNVLRGVGQLGFSVAHLRYTTNPETVQQAHSYVLETYADLGILGLLVTAALFISWLAATGPTIGLRRRWTALAADQRGERIGLLTLVAVVVGFGVQSALDWTWFFAGVAVPALLAAGWLIGRGPATDEQPLRTPGQRRSALDRPAALGATALLAALAVLGCWMVWRPLHSADLVTTAENANSTAAEFSAARAARGADPLSLTPYNLLSTLYLNAHQPAQARAVLTRATRIQPENPNAWALLAAFDVQQRQWKAAIPPLHEVQVLDRTPDAMTATNDAEIAQVFSHYHPPAPGS